VLPADRDRCVGHDRNSTATGRTDIVPTSPSGVGEVKRKERNIFRELSSPYIDRCHWRTTTITILVTLPPRKSESRSNVSAAVANKRRTFADGPSVQFYENTRTRRSISVTVGVPGAGRTGGRTDGAGESNGRFPGPTNELRRYKMALQKLRTSGGRRLLRSLGIYSASVYTARIPRPHRE